jgi:surfactin family lipopeptide synthetase C
MMDPNKKNIEAIYPLSPMQQGMLFHTLYQPEAGQYFEQLTCTISGKLDEQAFKKAWGKVIERNSILRTSFVWKKTSKMLQVVHKDIKIPLEILDWRLVNEIDFDSKFLQFLKNDREKGFNLSKAPLIRLTLIQTRENKYKFIWSNHHILLDGWSLPILWEELFSFYESFQLGAEIHLPARRSYRDYIYWLQGQDKEKAESFWKEYLAGFSTSTSIVIDTLPLEQSDAKYLKITEYLDENTSSVLKNLTKKHKITLNSIIQGAWSILLQRYSGDEDIVFGATFSGRPSELIGSETMVGLFINTLPVRVQIDPNKPVINFLQDLHAQQSKLREFEFTPLVDIQSWSEIPRNQSLFNSILVFENYPVDESLKDKKLSFEISDVFSSEKTNYPVTLVSGPGKKIALEMAFDTEVISQSSIQQMLSQLKHLITLISQSPLEKIKNLSILSDVVKQKILVDWNNTENPFPNDICIHEWFEQIVEQYPQNIAVKIDDLKTIMQN